MGPRYVEQQFAVNSKMCVRQLCASGLMLGHVPVERSGLARSLVTGRNDRRPGVAFMGRGPPTRCGATSYFLIDPNRFFVNDPHRKLYLTGHNPSGDPAAERALMGKVTRSCLVSAAATSNCCRRRFASDSESSGAADDDWGHMSGRMRRLGP